jgi:proteic killer suppression protein
VIRSFKHRGLKRLYELSEPRGIRPDLVHRIEEILTVLDRAATPQAMNLPGYRLHTLKGDRKGFWSVTVNANWRIVFRFESTEALEVDLIDYH